MAKLSPLQRVREDHGDKETLANKVIELLEAPEGESQDIFEHRIHTMSNRKLLRLWSAHQTLKEKFGDKESLVKAVTAAYFGAHNEDYAAKISGYTVPRLLDLARQNKVKSSS